MASDSDGSLIADKHRKKELSPNGKFKTAPLLRNGKTAKTRPIKEKKHKKGLCRVSNFLRIAIWFFIFTGLYCPSTIDLLEDSSPKVCKGYFHVTNLIFPIVQPYFETFAGPYIEPVRPYYVIVEKRFIKPVSTLGKKYGKPLVKETLVILNSYWLKFIQPSTQEYLKNICQYYDQNFGPYVNNATKAISPYYNKVKLNIQIVYFETILSYYNAAKPQIARSYNVAYDISLNNIYPCLKWTFINGQNFFVKTLGPQLKLIYGESIEPQLIKIVQRLSRYRDAKYIAFSSSEVESTSRYLASKTLASSSQYSADSIPASRKNQYSDPNATGEPSDPEAEIRKKAQEVVTRDLKDWQEKFSHAADEAADELEIRVTDISDKFISKQVEQFGEALLKELRQSVEMSLKKLKANIIVIIQESNDQYDGIEAIIEAVRKTGLTVNEKAQSLRIWIKTHNLQLTNNINKTIRDTLEILDTIQNIGMQEVGMRWAWTDGITYRDWAKYHAVKSRFTQWRYDVEQVALEHTGFRKARLKLEEFEIAALNITENAASELHLLQEIGIRKLSVKDTSDKFSVTSLPSHIDIFDQEYLKEKYIEPSKESNLGLVTTSSKTSEASTTASSALPEVDVRLS